MHADLANSNRLALVSKRETTQLRIVREPFYTNGLCGLDERDDLLAPLCELWRLLRLAARRLIEVVEQ